ncbi:hypothetical protein PF003_g11244 [Phytophthora fragariae]|nr:hypothetical protein PF003_g11244 [Phytophthora fragariae]
MPRVAVQWDPIRKEGNPTRSELVNNVIKTVKRFEVRCQGVQSAARRPIEYEEFVNLLTLVHAAQGKEALNIPGRCCANCAGLKTFQRNVTHRSRYCWGDGYRVVRRFLQEMFDDEAFHKLKDGNLAVSGRGCSQRTDGPLGPCFYVIKEGVKRVSDDLLVNQISSVIKQKMGRDLARELGVVLL